MGQRPNHPGPLTGIRVIEVGQLIAGPFAGSILAYYGAEVVKVEPPQGDPIRSWRGIDSGTSLWWRSLARNKKCVTLDLRQAPGRAACRRLIETSDVVVENFRPGRMEEWDLGPETFFDAHPRLVYARVSGFGQTGPYAARPGFAAVCEAMGGLRHLTGLVDEPPVRSNLSLGDSLGGLHAAMGVMLALHARARTGRGQVVDISLVEGVFNMLESVVPEYDRQKVIRPPSGTGITGIAPSGAYRCRAKSDEDPRTPHVVIGGNGNALFRRLMSAIDRGDLAARPDLQDNPGRVEHREELDAAIEAFTQTRTVSEVCARLIAAEVPVSPIYDAKDIAEDPHFRARGLFEEVDVDGQTLTLGAMCPKLSDTPGSTQWAGPNLGAHNDEILGGWLGLSNAERDKAVGR